MFASYTLQLYMQAGESGSSSQS